MKAKLVVLIFTVMLIAMLGGSFAYADDAMLSQDDPPLADGLSQINPDNDVIGLDNELILQGKVTKPWRAFDYVYDGKSHQGVAYGTGYTLSGDVFATNIGTYVVYATPSAGYVWADGSSAPVRLVWHITKPSSSGSGGGSYSGGGSSGTVQMHRLYNPYSGEHFYTGSDSEKNGLVAVGWSYEGVGWNAPASGDDVYRLYNRWSGDHHFTTSQSEKNACVSAGWTYEGVGWKSGGSTKVFREYNPFAKAFYHNYTASSSEHSGLCRVGWRDEGVGWYGV